MGEGGEVRRSQGGLGRSIAGRIFHIARSENRSTRSVFRRFWKKPMSNLGSAGLLWAINGGKLVELHRDWAVIELPVNRSQRIFSCRDVAAAKVILPWDRA